MELQKDKAVLNFGFFLIKKGIQDLQAEGKMRSWAGHRGNRGRTRMKFSNWERN